MIEDIEIIRLFGGYERMSKITNFLREVGAEMRKTSWPKGKELTKYTIVVISTVVVMGLFFTGVDLGISQLLSWFLDL
jgi:preprotein translocase subunit SecE